MYNFQPAIPNFMGYIFLPRTHKKYYSNKLLVSLFNIYSTVGEPNSLGKMARAAIQTQSNTHVPSDQV